MMNTLRHKEEPHSDRFNSASNSVAGPDPWVNLQSFTSARIAIGRTGGSQRTPSVLDFRLAHAQARDAVHAEFKCDTIEKQLSERGFKTERLYTSVADRASYLMNPNMGRRLSDESREKLKGLSSKWDKRDFAVVISDGLSASAAHNHAAETVSLLMKYLDPAKWSLYPIFIVPFGRVKIQDDIGGILGARHSIIFLGERPGLGSPDSLSAYFTYRPHWECTESDRNCISNIRAEGMPPDAAARKLSVLLSESLRLGIGGTSLKDTIPVNSQIEEGSG